jgi:hypothetical protein
MVEVRRLIHGEDLQDVGLAIEQRPDEPTILGHSWSDFTDRQYVSVFPADGSVVFRPSQHA